MAITLPAPVLLGIRAAQALFAIIVLGTMGYVSSWWHSDWYSATPSSIAFAIFVAVWTLFAVVFLVVAPWKLGMQRQVIGISVLAVEALTTIFWFAGFIAPAVWLTGRVCYGSVCSNAIAGTVFAAFEWLLFVATTTFAVLFFLNNRNSTTAPKIHSSGPGMTVQEGV